ncbi:hypothetical protein C8R45DRAFT_989328 [Mycena sanguinolenta]|nr:hypothetical protein C8R45DRAFT_989328 [Mycena sanguinolenta]
MAIFRSVHQARRFHALAPVHAVLLFGFATVPGRDSSVGSSSNRICRLRAWADDVPSLRYQVSALKIHQRRCGSFPFLRIRTSCSVASGCGTSSSSRRRLGRSGSHCASTADVLLLSSSTRRDLGVLPPTPIHSARGCHCTCGWEQAARALHVEAAAVHACARGRTPRPCPSPRWRRCLPSPQYRRPLDQRCCTTPIRCDAEALPRAQRRRRSQVLADAWIPRWHPICSERKMSRCGDGDELRYMLEIINTSTFIVRLAWRMYRDSDRCRTTTSLRAAMKEGGRREACVGREVPR